MGIASFNCLAREGLSREVEKGAIMKFVGFTLWLAPFAACSGQNAEVRMATSAHGASEAAVTTAEQKKPSRNPSCLICL